MSSYVKFAAAANLNLVRTVRRCAAMYLTDASTAVAATVKQEKHASLFNQQEAVLDFVCSSFLTGFSRWYQPSVLYS